MTSSTSRRAQHASRPFGGQRRPAAAACHDARVSVAYAAQVSRGPRPRSPSAPWTARGCAAAAGGAVARAHQLPALSEATLRATRSWSCCAALLRAAQRALGPRHARADGVPGRLARSGRRGRQRVALRQRASTARWTELGLEQAAQQEARPVRRALAASRVRAQDGGQAARGRGGKRKAAPMAAVLDPVPLFKTCRACGTHVHAAGASGTEAPRSWLRCFLRLERADLFDKKRRQQKELKTQDAAGEEAGGVQASSRASRRPLRRSSLKFTRRRLRRHGRLEERKKDRKQPQGQEEEEETPAQARGGRRLGQRRPHADPSPAQMNGFVYADRAPELRATPQVSAFAEVLDGSDDQGLDGAERDGLHACEVVGSEAEERAAGSLLCWRIPASASKKRKTSSSRSKRVEASAPTTPAAVAVPPAPAVKKRARTKKELARERELRALGQILPGLQRSLRGRRPEHLCLLRLVRALGARCLRSSLTPG
ncbi:uncharacterized protein IUM83_05588 [Phytophthora cinnamomi]|uniref:uncharacterized protein n=1 Tax=Phytophthora cinnamomi TaxID=4785 RepID=UPI00355A9E22|nr:hypothetical protein IUM83_05588 [Phytophthora cinnamomi]